MSCGIQAKEDWKKMSDSVLVTAVPGTPLKELASYTSGLRPHTHAAQVAEGPIHGYMLMRFRAGDNRARYASEEAASNCFFKRIWRPMHLNRHSYGGPQSTCATTQVA